MARMARVIAPRYPHHVTQRRHVVDFTTVFVLSSNKLYEWHLHAAKA